ncbi:VgrG-related protein [Streptomyces sp. NPDC055085]
MATPLDLGNTATRKARVLIGPGEPTPLPFHVDEAIERVVVETATLTPGMFEITFRDDGGKITEEAGIVIGSAVSISAEGGMAGETPEAIMSGEVFSIDAVCQDLLSKTIVRGYERSLNMQRIKKTRTFIEMTDSDIALEIAGAASLEIGLVVPTTYVFTHIAQFNQTDWEFLQWRAQEIGYEVGISHNSFFFRPSTGTAEGVAIDDAAALESPALPLEFKRNLIEFLPSLSSAGLVQSVEVRSWDPGLAEPLIGSSPAESTSAVVTENPVSMATQTSGDELPPLPVVTDSILNPAEISPPVDPEAYLVYDRPIDTGPTAETALEQFAVSLADQRGSTFLEAEGYAIGDPNIQAGGPVEVIAVPARFVGIYQVTRARHIFDDELGGYYTRFWVTGRQNRSLFGLASGKDQVRPPRIRGVVCGIVTNNFDTGTPPKGRVKLAFPWLSPDYESDWAPVVQAGAGPTTGLLWIPQVGDQVLVTFEFGDIRRPYVLGGIPSDLSEDLLTLGLGGPPVESDLGSVYRRGMVSPTGMNLAFTDIGPPDAPPEMSEVSIGSFENTMALQINQTTGSISLNCFPVPGEDSDSPEGNITISVGEAGNIAITSGGTIDLTAEGAINFSAPAINFEVEGEFSIAAGGAINIEAGGTMDVEAPLITLNA